MPVLEVGRVCIKTKGRNTGKKVVVVGLEKGFALVDGIDFKKKKCNFLHLFPTSRMISISKNSTHKEIETLLKEVRIDG